MWQIGVWEQEEGLGRFVEELAGKIGAQVHRSNHPALLAGKRLDLLVVSPAATSWAGAHAVSCHTALLPGWLSPLRRSLPACQVVSYGTASANTLTLSSLGEERWAVAVQREFSTLGGQIVERQELILPHHHTTPQLFLAQVGAALLIGYTPGAVGLSGN